MYFGKKLSTCKGHGNNGNRLALFDLWAAKVSGKEKSDSVRNLSAPLRKAGQGLLRELLPTQASRQEIAEALGISMRSINSLLYEGKGSLDLIVACLIKASALKDKDVKRILALVSDHLHTAHPVVESDRRWRQLAFSEEEKLRWILVMELYSKVAKDSDS